MNELQEMFENTVWNEELGYAYNPNTGQMWKVAELHIARYGQYRNQINGITIAGVYKKYTHIIWKMMTGEWPALPIIDHKDGDTFNNTWENLREATRSQNNANRESNGRWADGTDGLGMGVKLTHSNKYEVRICRNGKFYHCGTYDTVKEANAVASAKRKEIHNGFVREDDQ